MGVFLAATPLSSLPPHLEVRSNAWETEGEMETVRNKRSWAGTTVLHNICCCCMTCLVTLRITARQSTSMCVATGMCERQARDGAERVVCSHAHGWVGGLLLIAQLSLLITSVSNQCKRWQEPKWHFSTLITHVSFVAQLSFTFSWCHAAPICSHFASDVLSSLGTWIPSFRDAQWHKRYNAKPVEMGCYQRWVSESKSHIHFLQRYY